MPSLDATLQVYMLLFIINQQLYLLSELKFQGFLSDPLEIIYHALIMANVKYVLPAITGCVNKKYPGKKNSVFQQT